MTEWGFLRVIEDTRQTVTHLESCMGNNKSDEVSVLTVLFFSLTYCAGGGRGFTLELRNIKMCEMPPSEFNWLPFGQGTYF